ncbi:DUF1153 domain-containing protein [Phenylobacterium conjunctum]|uniref:DUF1153 domain-containing protein n=1 Tax=Phenylobacterium conjunctum TaxID=1298959 RepID=A0ABW3SZS8_9CAUL
MSVSEQRVAPPPMSVIGPLGLRLKAEDLPPADIDRWVPRRKAELVVAIRSGLITLEAAQARYGLTMEEIANWLMMFDRHGVPGLRVTMAKAYRSTGRRRRA